MYITVKARTLRRLEEHAISATLDITEVKKEGEDYYLQLDNKTFKRLHHKCAKANISQDELLNNMMDAIERSN